MVGINCASAVNGFSSYDISQIGTTITPKQLLKDVHHLDRDVILTDLLVLDAHHIDGDHKILDATFKTKYPLNSKNDRILLPMHSFYRLKFGYIFKVTSLPISFNPLIAGTLGLRIFTRLVQFRMQNGNLFIPR